MKMSRGGIVMPFKTSRNSAGIVSGNRAFHILLVSYQYLICLTIQNYFKNSNVIVRAAGSVSKALELFRKNKFDAVLAELRSDSDGGIELHRRLRELNRTMPILFMTSLAHWSDARLLDQVVEDPHSFYIPENAGHKFLAAKLKQVIQAYRSRDSLTGLKRKFKRNWVLASLLQRAMLPPWVYFSDHYEFSCFYRPLTRVSGDLFEWLPLDDDRALFIFGDVSGHGPHSALAMTAVQSFLKQMIAMDREKARRPDLIAAEINDFFHRHLHNIVYMAALIAHIDFRHNRICYQNAGYIDLLCIDAATGTPVTINPEKKGSLPLGMMKNTVYSSADNVEYEFTDTSVFLACSDGLMDLAKDEKGESNMDMSVYTQLAAILVKAAQREDKSLAIPFRCYHALEQFGYLHPQDDLAMVLIRKPLHLEREYIFTCRVPADKKAVDQVSQKASDFIMRHYRNEKLSVNVELLLAEHLGNVVRHGLNEYEKLHEYMAVKLYADERELKLIVWDRGREWRLPPQPRHSADRTLDRLNRQFAPSGRGLPIIAKIASDMCRLRYSGLNESIFILPVPGDT